jgi:hypothetical protein
MLSVCYDLHETDGNILSCGARSDIFASMEKQEDKVGVAHMLPSRFKRWREVLHAEIGDTSKRDEMEQDILA